uniref:Uncharacterized protein n=1 Tax=Anopheles stephensi TaxID=30069 RepID=A0A182YSZ5_ANOST
MANENQNMELMDALAQMIAQSLKASIGPAVEQISASLRTSGYNAEAPRPKPPSFTMPEYGTSEGTTVAD